MNLERLEKISSIKKLLFNKKTLGAAVAGGSVAGIVDLISHGVGRTRKVTDNEEEMQRARLPIYNPTEAKQKIMKPGDIMLTRYRNPGKGVMENTLDNLSDFVQNSKYRHSALYVGDGKYVEYQGYDSPKHKLKRGVQKYDLKDMVKEKDFIIVRPKVDDEQKINAINYALGEIGKKKYSKNPTIDYIKLVAAPSSKWSKIKRNDPETTCGNFVQKSYNKTNFIDHKNKNPKHILPVELFASDKTKAIGVVKAAMVKKCKEKYILNER